MKTAQINSRSEKKSHRSPFTRRKHARISRLQPPAGHNRDALPPCAGDLAVLCPGDQAALRLRRPLLPTAARRSSPKGASTPPPEGAPVRPWARRQTLLSSASQPTAPPPWPLLLRYQKRSAPPLLPQRRQAPEP
jgi:hypothetical protein